MRCSPTTIILTAELHKKFDVVSYGVHHLFCAPLLYRAVQNFKEPADPYLQYEMLDFQNSDIPVLNDPQQQQQDCKEQEGLHNASRLQAAAAAGAQAAAHLRQRQRRSGSASSTTAAAAAGSADAVSKLQSSPQARTVLDGGYSSSSSSGSSGAQGSSNSAAGRDMGGDGGSSRASSQAVHQTDTAVPAAATDMQQQVAGLQQHTDSVPQQTQLQAQPEQQLVVGLQQQLAAVHAAAAHGCHRHQQQQQQQQHGGLPLQQWPVPLQVQVLSELRSTCSPCDTPSLSPLPLQQLAGGGELQQALFYGSLSGC